MAFGHPKYNLWGLDTRMHLQCKGAENAWTLVESALFQAAHSLVRHDSNFGTQHNDRKASDSPMIFE
jgi:hypothetical protein